MNKNRAYSYTENAIIIARIVNLLIVVLPFFFIKFPQFLLRVHVRSLALCIFARDKKSEESNMIQYHTMMMKRTSSQSNNNTSSREEVLEGIDCGAQYYC